MRRGIVKGWDDRQGLCPVRHRQRYAFGGSTREIAEPRSTGAERCGDAVQSIQKNEKTITMPRPLRSPVAPDMQLATMPYAVGR